MNRNRGRSASGGDIMVFGVRLDYCDETCIWTEFGLGLPVSLGAFAF